MTSKKDKEKRKQLICVGALVFLLSASALSYLATRSGEETQPTQRIQVSVNFGKPGETYTEIINISKKKTAEDVFNQVASLGVDINDRGELQVVKVSAGNYTATVNETHEWVFYVNGELKLETIDSYNVVPGRDLYVELRLEEEPF